MPMTNGPNSDSDGLCAKSDEKLHLKLDGLGKKMDNLDEKLEQRMLNLETRIDDLDGKLDDIDFKFDDLDSKFDDKMDDLDCSNFGNMDEKLADFDYKMTDLDYKIADLSYKMVEFGYKLDDLSLRNDFEGNHNKPSRSRKCGQKKFQSKFATKPSPQIGPMVSMNPVAPKINETNTPWQKAISTFTKNEPILRQRMLIPEITPKRDNEPIIRDGNKNGSSNFQYFQTNSLILFLFSLDSVTNGLPLMPTEKKESAISDECKNGLLKCFC